MSTPLTDSINALTAYANEVTGASDTTLSDAVETLVAGFGKGESVGALWKSVTLEEDHTTTNVGNPVYWREFLGIPEQDVLDGYIFFCEVSGNSGFPAQYYMLHGFYHAYNNNIQVFFIRGDVNGGMGNYKNNYNLFATAGTAINVYRLKADKDEQVYFNEVNPWLRAFKFESAKENILPSTLTIDISGLYFLGLPNDWNINSGLEHLIIKGNKSIRTTNVFALGDSSVCMFDTSRNVGIKDITFVDGAKLYGQNQTFFQYYVDLEAIYGELDYTDVTAWTYNNPFLSCQKLKHLRLKKDSAKTVSALDFKSLIALDDDSLISIGNGLGVVTDTHTISFYSTQKTRCSSIMGNNDNGTFIADENGTMTLADFIANVKGWTLS